MVGSRSRSRVACRGGATLKQLRKSAKACGLKRTSRSRKCALVKKLVASRCKNIVKVSPKQMHSRKYKLKSPSRSRKQLHKLKGKSLVFHK